jgi:hypothetical protein
MNNTSGGVIPKEEFEDHSGDKILICSFYRYCTVVQWYARQDYRVEQNLPIY